MTITGGGTRPDASRDMSGTLGEVARGWYLYGITRRGPLAAVLAEAGAGDSIVAGITAAPDESPPLQLLECAGLAAVVSPVPLAAFSPAVLQERLRSASALEEMVRSHNRVVEAIHARQAILPAKFGMVYADAGEILAALRYSCDTVLPQLQRLEECDEWALHLRADRAVVRERAAARSPAIACRRGEHAAARPGRAYFLERQLRDELEATTRQALIALAQNAFDRLAGCAVAGQVNPTGPVADATDEVEILRAAFLVAREDVKHFEAEVASLADGDEGLWCECTGPWPPYSFAAVDVEAP